MSPRGRGGIPAFQISTIVVAYVLVRGLIIAHTTKPSNDGPRFLTFASRLSTEPVLDVLRTSDDHPGYPSLLYGAHALGALAGWDSPRETLVVAQATSALAGLVFVLILHRLFSRLSFSLTAWAATLAIVFLPRPAWTTSDILADAVHAMFWAGAALCVVEGLLEHRRRWWLLGGLFAALAYCVRVDALTLPASVVAAGFLLSASRTYRATWPWRERLVAAGAFFAPLVPTWGAFFLVYGNLSPKPALKGLLGAAFPGGVSNEHAIRAAGLFATSLPKPLVGFAEYAECVSQDLQYVHLFLVPLALLAAWRRRFSLAPVLFLVTAFCVYSAVLVALWHRQGYMVGRYLLPVLPLVVFATMVGAEKAGARIGLRLGRSIRSARRGRRALVGAMVALSLGFSLPSLAGRSLHEDGWGLLEAGTWLARHRQPGESVYDPYYYPTYLAGIRGAVTQVPAPDGAGAGLYIIMASWDTNRARDLGRRVAKGGAKLVAAFPRRKGGDGRDVLVYHLSSR